MRTCFLLAAMLLSLTTSVQAAGHVYLLKGFAGIFSTGLDTLHDKLTARGITATVHSYSDYDSLAAEAAHLKKSGKGPIVIVGHSLGADAAFQMAERMKELGARVALVVSFGPNGSSSVTSNVAQVINYYQNGSTVHRGQGFTGIISNINLDRDPEINHLNIEKNSRLQAKVIAKIESVMRFRDAISNTK